MWKRQLNASPTTQARDPREPISIGHQQENRSSTTFLVQLHHQAGRPLRTYETIINLVSNTTNRGGLVVRARLDRRHYPIGKKVSAKERRELKIEPDEFHDDWNYVIKPRSELR